MEVRPRLSSLLSFVCLQFSEPCNEHALYRQWSCPVPNCNAGPCYTSRQALMLQLWTRQC